MPVGIAYGDDVDKAMTVLAEILEQESRVLADPAAQVMVIGLGDSSVNINLRCWCNASDYWNLLFDLTRAVKLKLDQEGISIPFPQRDIHIIGAAVENAG